MPIIDFNADVGEGIKNETLLMPYLTSCNIACGGHAGDVDEMTSVIALAKYHQVNIGAHPSYPDKTNFGRVELDLPANELADSIYNQVLLLHQLVTKEGLSLTHIKPHGALYHQVARDIKTARILIEIVKQIDPHMALVGLPNSVVHKASEKANIRFIKEGFADRRYHDDGSLVSRKEAGAVLHDTNQVIEQVRTISHKNKVKTTTNQYIDMAIDSICFHSDTENASDLLKSCYHKINTLEND